MRKGREKMYEKITLPNGVRIVYEHMPHVRSAAVGIWVGAGSRYEKVSEGGSAHFVEHMLFKGTNKYSARELADKMDAIGGQVNAYTTRENTCYYARVPDYHLDTAIELLGDMFFDSKFDQVDVESERGVILEEIDMYNDAPDDVVTERLMLGCFKGALGRPILGKASVLEKMDSQSLREFKESRYTSGRVVVALAGSFTEETIKRIEARFSVMEKKTERKPQTCRYAPCVTVKRKATEQNHLCLGFPGLPAGSEKRFAVQLMSGMLGEGMSSRLFQTVREKYGLCYSIGSFSGGFAETGLFAVATAMGKETELKAIGLIMDEIRRFREDGVTQDELDRAREQVKANLVMSLESTTAHMNKLGFSTLCLDRCLSPEELIEGYDTVTTEDILSLSRQVLDFEQMSFSAVGRVSAAEEYEKMFQK